MLTSERMDVSETELKREFACIKDEVTGVLLFGSAAKGEQTSRSDIDIALVSPRDKNVLRKVFARTGANYDVKAFEELPLLVKMDIIAHHRVIIGDEVELSHYFRRFRKEWNDMHYRIKTNQFKSAAEMIAQRRAWLRRKHERTIP
jgi:predicted nucleotidyltransferase